MNPLFCTKCFVGSRAPAVLKEASRHPTVHHATTLLLQGTRTPYPCNSQHPRGRNVRFALAHPQWFFATCSQSRTSCFPYPFPRYFSSTARLHMYGCHCSGGFWIEGAVEEIANPTDMNNRNCIEPRQTRSTAAQYHVSARWRGTV